MGIGALIYGGLSLIVSYGAFGENGTQDVLKGMNGLFWILNLSFFHTLLEWSLSFNLFPCSNFLEMAWSL